MPRPRLPEIARYLGSGTKSSFSSKTKSPYGLLVQTRVMVGSQIPKPNQ